MCTVLVTYDPKNKVANGLMKTLSYVRGVKIDDEALLTDKELIREQICCKEKMYAKIDEGIAEYKAGKTKTLSSKEEIHNFLNSL